MYLQDSGMTEEEKTPATDVSALLIFATTEYVPYGGFHTTSRIQCDVDYSITITHKSLVELSSGRDDENWLTKAENSKQNGDVAFFTPPFVHLYVNIVL